MPPATSAGSPAQTPPTGASTAVPGGWPAPEPLRLVVGDRCWDVAGGDVIVVGRGADADIRLAHPEVSRRHARVEWNAADGWVAHDLGSVNGLHVDGLRVRGVGLRPGVAVRLGPHADAPVLRVEAGDDTGAGLADAPEEFPATGSIVARDDGNAPRGITVGRAGDNDIVVDDLLVSRHHARVIRTADGYRVDDLGSRNGTYVNGQAVTSATIGPHDRLALGGLEFHVVDGDLTMIEPETRVGLSATGIGVSVGSGKHRKRLLDGVDVSVPAGGLLAVVGPSGAGKSTLLDVLVGNRRADEGTVTLEGRDLYDNLDELRHRIGLVPQDDVVHRHLTVWQALDYASRLRFPADLDAADRRARIHDVLGRLDLTQHLHTRIDRLSGGQRKRTSVALELLTGPSLLFLDEPTSGLDPGLDKSVMRMLRGLADEGRTVVVVTHSVAHLDLCDAVLLLAPGGRVAYHGPAAELLDHFGLDDFSDVFTLVAQEPERVAEEFRRRVGPRPATPPAAPEQGTPAPRPRQSRARQVATLAARHLRVFVADRSYALFVALLPVVLGLLVTAVPGEAGFGPPRDPMSTEACELLVVLIVGAAFMGTAASVRDLVGERAIYRREKGVGLSPGAYLAAKLLVFGGLALAQSAVLVGIVLLLVAPPDTHVALGDGRLELFVATFATTYASAALGLVISAWVSTSEQVMPLLVIGIMAQLVLCGGLVDLAGQTGLEQLAWFTPTRWGYAAAAVTTDVYDRVHIGRPDPLWEHTSFAWWRAVGLLGALWLAGVVATGARLAREGRPR